MARSDMSLNAWGELLLLGLIWGGTFFAIAIAQTQIGPLTVVLHRVFWGALVLWLIVAARGLAIPRGWRVWGALFVMGLLNNVIPFSLMSWGQTQIESGLVSIFNAMTAPLGVLAAALLLRDEPLTRARATGVLMAFVGAVIVIGPSRLGALDPAAMAQWAVIAGALSYAFASVWAKIRLSGVSPLVASAGMLTGSTVTMIPIAVLAEGVPSFALGAEVIAAVAYYAVICTALAYLLYYRVLKTSGAGNLMLVTLIIPPTAIFLGWAFLDESPGGGAIAGFGLIALGLAVIDGRLFRRPAAQGRA